MMLTLELFEVVIVELIPVILDHFQNLVVSVVNLLDTRVMDVTVDDVQMHLMLLYVVHCEDGHYLLLYGVNVNVDVLHCEMLHVTIVHVNDDVDDVHDDEHGVYDDEVHVYGHDCVTVNVNLIAVTVKMCHRLTC